MEIDKAKIKKRPKVAPDKRKSIVLTIRVNPTISKFLKDQDISPTGLFYEALKAVGFK